MLGALGSSLLLPLMVGRTQYLYKDYFKCIFADYNDTTLALHNAIFKNNCFPYMFLRSSQFAS